MLGKKIFRIIIISIIGTFVSIYSFNVFFVSLTTASSLGVGISLVIVESTGNNNTGTGNNNSSSNNNNKDNIEDLVNTGSLVDTGILVDTGLNDYISGNLDIISSGSIQGNSGEQHGSAEDEYKDKKNENIKKIKTIKKNLPIEEILYCPMSQDNQVKVDSDNCYSGNVCICKLVLTVENYAFSKLSYNKSILIKFNGKSPDDYILGNSMYSHIWLGKFNDAICYKKIIIEKRRSKTYMTYKKVFSNCSMFRYIVKFIFSLLR